MGPQEVVAWGAHLQWGNILLTELAFVMLVLFSLGLIKLPKIVLHRKLSRFFPWGYYPDQVPKKDPGFCPEGTEDFLHNQGTDFAGMNGIGDYGEFSGFGELGEFGQSFWGGGE